MFATTASQWYLLLTPAWPMHPGDQREPGNVPFWLGVPRLMDIAALNTGGRPADRHVPLRASPKTAGRLGSLFQFRSFGIGFKS
jgi:hypothetical protein